MAPSRSEPASAGRSTFVNIVKGFAYAALLGLLALAVAVAVAMAYLPSYSDLTQRSDLGQMVRPHLQSVYHHSMLVKHLSQDFGQKVPLKLGIMSTISPDEIIDLLQSLWSGRGQTLVIVTHDSSIARRAPRIAWIRDGRLSPESAATTVS